MICGLSGATTKRMNNLDFQECKDTGLQRIGLDLETKEFNEYVDGLNARSIILEVGGDETIAGAKCQEYNIGSRGDETIAGAKADLIMQNYPLYELLPTLSISYSLRYSVNE